MGTTAVTWRYSVHLETFCSPFLPKWSAVQNKVNGTEQLGAHSGRDYSDLQILVEASYVHTALGFDSRKCGARDEVEVTLEGGLHKAVDSYDTASWQNIGGAFFNEDGGSGSRTWRAG